MNFDLSSLLSFRAPSPKPVVQGASKVAGSCDCATPRPNRRNRCQNCYRDLPPEPAMGVRPGFEDCPFYEPLEIVRGDLIDTDETGEPRANFILKHPESGDCWAIQAPPQRFPMLWWTMRVPGGSSDGAFAQLVNPVESLENLVAFARVLQGLPAEQVSPQRAETTPENGTNQPPGETP